MTKKEGFIRGIPERTYIDSKGNTWVIRTLNTGLFELWPQDKGQDCIEADVVGSMKAAKRLIEHMATADEIERAKWSKATGGE